MVREKKASYPVQVLAHKQPVLGEFPQAILVLHEQVQRLIQLAVQAKGVVLLIRLGDSRRRPLDMQLQILPLALADPRIARNLLLVRLLVAHGLGAHNLPPLRVADERLALGVHGGRLVADEHLVVPRLGAVAAVDANVPGGGAAVPGLALPFDVCGRAFFVVEVSAEGQGEALVQALLVEEVGLLEGGEVAGDEGWAGDDGGGEDAVCFCWGLGGGGDGGDVLGGCCCC